MRVCMRDCVNGRPRVADDADGEDAEAPRRRGPVGIDERRGTRGGEPERGVDPREFRRVAKGDGGEIRRGQEEAAVLKIHVVSLSPHRVSRSTRARTSVWEIAAYTGKGGGEGWGKGEGEEK